MTTCMFAGHRDVYHPMINVKIKEAIWEFLKTDSEFIFYTGGMGEFDRKCASAVHSAKRQFPHLKIRLALVLPYMSHKLNREKAYYESYYDGIIIPEELCDIHYKAAIQRRNRWMVDRTDCLIAYVFRDSGGAFETVRYAKKEGKPVINLAEQI